MINMVALMGRLTFEPEVRTTPSGVSVMRFQVACDRSYQKSGQDRQADFIDCVAWRQTAEFISRYFHKGSMIAVEGTLQTSSYTDKNGNQRKQVEVLANNVSFCGSKSETGSAAGSQANPNYSSADNSDFDEIPDDDDLPF
ncbi:single-stranded DNA-binding protein [Eubacterium sp.]|jgi:single-strand DNA-binding protein